MGEKCFVYFSLPLRMFCSLLQNTDNQNVLREGGGRRRKPPIDLAHVLRRSAMSSRAPDLSELMQCLKSNMPSHRDYDETSFVISVWFFFKL